MANRRTGEQANRRILRLKKLFKRIARYAKRYFTEKEYRYHFHTVLICLTIKDFLSDERFLKRIFRDRTGYDLDLENPQTFNEKLQWLKLHNKNPEYTVMVDKYKVKKYIADKLGEQYVVPLLGVYDNADDIDFSKLPDKFVLKCNHNSGGGMYICQDKSRLNEKKIKSIRKNLNKNVSRNYFYEGREWPYKNVERKIIAEKFIENKGENGLHDYKVWCFNGRAEYIYYIKGILTDDVKAGFFDRNWNLQNFTHNHILIDEPVPKPERLNELISLSEKLAKDIPFVRTDFYITDDGKIYFGEITFFPMGGCYKWQTERMDLELGKLIDLSLAKDISGGK